MSVGCIDSSCVDSDSFCYGGSKGRISTLIPMSIIHAKLLTKLAKKHAPTCHSRHIGFSLAPSPFTQPTLARGLDNPLYRSKTSPWYRQTIRPLQSIRSSFAGLRAPGLPLRLLALPFCGPRLARPFPGGGRTNAKSTSIVWSSSFVLCAPSIAARASSSVGYSIKA
jgi:hypothetical protein